MGGGGGGGGGGKEVQIKKWNVPNQLTTYVVCCPKQTSRVLELSKIVFLSPNELNVLK